MSTFTEEPDFYEMVAVENLIGETVPVELFELSLKDQDPTITGETIIHEESEITGESMDIETIPAYARVPAKFGVPFLVEVVSFTKAPATNEDFISLEGYASDEESELAEDISSAESQISASSEESLLTEDPVRAEVLASMRNEFNIVFSQESMDIVEIVSAEFAVATSGRFCLDDSPSLSKNCNVPPPWDHTQHLASPKHSASSEAIGPRKVDHMNVRLDNLIPMLEREQELRAKLFGRRMAALRTPPPAFTQTLPVTPKRMPPACFIEPPLKKINVFYGGAEFPRRR